MRKHLRKAFVLASLCVHLSVFYALKAAALRPEKPKMRHVELAIMKPKPPEPEPPPPPPPPPKKVIDLTKKVEIKKDPQLAAEPPPTAEPPPPPIFGVTLSSTSNANTGMSVRVGNTTMVEPGERVDPKDVKPLNGGGEGKGPVSVAQVSKLPEKIGECPPFDTNQLYTDAAREKEIEGKVTLDVIIGADGSVVEVKLVKGIDQGLDAAAIATMKKHCKWRAGEMGVQKVTTKIRYTFTFVLPD
ncbi:MAG: energy transducer TonB [Deltaproteobacteria bacterium]|nr:energy transducer TonB [Deltaproteobacteria bacterium]